MNRVDMSWEDIEEPLWLPAADRFARAALAAAGIDGWDLSVVFSSDAFMRTLNRDYRGKDEPTDVLSFESGEAFEEDGEKRIMAGDIVISLDTLAVNAEYFGVSRDEELKRLIVHGILHLAGSDHGTNDPGEPMLVRQESLLVQLSEVSIL